MTPEYTLVSLNEQQSIRKALNMNTEKKVKAYPNRKRLREFYSMRKNKSLTFQQFKATVLRDIDVHNAKVYEDTQKEVEVV